MTRGLAVNCIKLLEYIDTATAKQEVWPPGSADTVFPAGL